MPAPTGCVRGPPKSPCCHTLAPPPDSTLKERIPPATLGVVADTRSSLPEQSSDAKRSRIPAPSPAGAVAAGAVAGAVSHLPGFARVARLHSSEHCAPAVKSSLALSVLPVVLPLHVVESS